ncbi:MAG: phosphoribosyltransferase family protein [Candidatus Saccharimonas sp.]
MRTRYKPLFTKEHVDARITELAATIAADHQHMQPLFVALLRGANPFASKLMFALASQNTGFHPELDYMVISTYGHDHTARQPVMMTDLAPTTIVTGRPVIIIDDVIDQGVTSDFVAALLTERGAASVKLAVLASKNVTTRTKHADYIGFETGDKWLVGMGLDDAHSGHEHYRWLEEIWEITS